MKRGLLLPGVLIVVLAALGFAGADTPEAGVQVTVVPDPAWLVPGDGMNKLNFDMLLENKTSEVLEIKSILMTARDASGTFLTSRELNDLGMCPALATIPKRTLEPGKTLLLFNPFYEFPSHFQPASLQYTLTLGPPPPDKPESEPAPAARPLEVVVTVKTKPAVLKTPLILPVAGKVFIWEGSEFYAHHRRFDLTHPFVLETGVKHNIGRYGMDFMMVDAQGRRFRTDGKTPADYLVYGLPVRSPADGVVVDCIDGRIDSPIGKQTVDYETFMKTHDLKLFGGNWIIIQHAEGEYSYMAHLKPGSLKVKPGDKVRSGQVIAQVGNSGDSLEPHLHYHLLSQPQLDCETVPAIFHHFLRWYGNNRVEVKSGALDSGDVVESR